MIALYSVKEAAKLLQVSTSTLYKYAERREIGYVKIGAALRFSEENLEKFVAERTSEPDGHGK